MLKKVVLVTGMLGTILALAAVGCSGSSTDGVAGDDDSGAGENDGSTGFAKDGGNTNRDGGTKIDGSVTITDGGTVIVHDGGGTIVNEGGIVVETDSGTSPIKAIDAGAAVIDSGTVVEPDGGTTGSCFVNSAALQLNVTTPVAHQNRCTSTQITTFNTSCLGSGATTAACDALVSADGDCADCLFGGNPDGGLGSSPVLLPVGNLEQVNFDGCLAAISTAPAACKLQYEELSFCADTTCATCTTDTSDLSCLQFSETDPSAACATDFPVDGTCATAVEGSISVADEENLCASNALDFTTAYTITATTMCGP